MRLPGVRMWGHDVPQYDRILDVVLPHTLEAMMQKLISYIDNALWRWRMRQQARKICRKFDQLRGDVRFEA